MRVLTAPILGLAVAAFAVGYVRAATFDVTTSADSGPVSFCPVLTDARSNARPDLIDSTCGVRGVQRPPVIFLAGFEEGDCQALAAIGCDGGDSDFCFEGTLACGVGAPMCSDTTGSTTESCNGIDDDCDGDVDEDFNPNDNPACTASATFMGNVSGDTASPTLTAQGMSEEWLRFRMTENDSAIQSRPLGVRIVLEMPPGLDYDLFAYCVSCSGVQAGASFQPGSGVQEIVTFGKSDVTGVDDSRDIIVEVRHRAHTICASWSLTVTGNVTSPARPCDQ